MSVEEPHCHPPLQDAPRPQADLRDLPRPGLAGRLDRHIPNQGEHFAVYKSSYDLSLYIEQAMRKIFGMSV